MISPLTVLVEEECLYLLAFADTDEPNEGRQAGLIGCFREPGQCEGSFRQKAALFRQLCRVSLWSTVY